MGNTICAQKNRLSANKYVRYFGLFLMLIVLISLVYKLSPHKEMKTIMGSDVRSYWRWGKVYRQDVSYVTNPRIIYRVLFYSRKNVPFFFTPGFRGCLSPVIREYYEDTNYDGKWDLEAVRNPITGEFSIREDTDYDGKPDKTYTKNVN